jgi:transposase-like protein
MKRSRFNEEQIIAILREQEAGAKTADVCRKHGISGTTFDKWKAEYGVRRDGGVGRPPAEGARGRERQAEEAVGRGGARQRHSAGRGSKKMVTPAAKREAASYLGQVYQVSQRRACQVIGMERHSIRYRGWRREDGLIRSVCARSPLCGGASAIAGCTSCRSTNVSCRTHNRLYLSLGEKRGSDQPRRSHIADFRIITVPDLSPNTRGLSGISRQYASTARLIPSQCGFA